MLALAAANAVGVVLFGALYGVAGARLVPQLAFLVGLVVLFVFMTAVWIRTEARHRELDIVRRIGRVVAGLGGVVVVVPVVVLAPLFWLDEQLPVEAGLRAARGGVMALVLIALVLVVLVNLMGVLVVLARAVVSWRLGGRSVTPPSGRISA
jgi:hypothetical protein